jgi:protein NEDD1
VPLTTVTFSAEGAAIYLGTENGKLLVLDLRGLDKPPKTIIVSEAGAGIRTMTTQVHLALSCFAASAYA